MDQDRNDGKVPVTLKIHQLSPLKINVKVPEVKMMKPKHLKFSLSQKLHRVVIISLTREDSLKHCPHCNAVQYRRHFVQGPMNINLRNPGLPIIEPRVSNRDSFWNIGIIRDFIATPSYTESTDWFKVWHEVACSNKQCQGHIWHEVSGRTGYRKFGFLRKMAVYSQCICFPKSFTFVEPPQFF